MIRETRRNRGRKGQELIEFSLTALLLAGLLVSSFVVGMNLIRSIQVNQSCRDVANMYIHGADFSTYPMQQLTQRLATGLDLEIGTTFTGNSATNTSNQGNVLVTLSRVMYIGATTDPNCASVGAGKCTNANSFVFTQRIQFGNGTLANTKPSTLGNPSATAISTAGVIANPVTDAGAKLPTGAQASFATLWRTPLQDGQICYVAEFYAQSPDLNLGSFLGGGVYARSFF
ncbi:MAG TPA: hypothetical protein VN893_16615 [Bryobacteraceae bacterium]|nr:hypothetical protein [Bryobacteraceae bacterium]